MTEILFLFVSLCEVKNCHGCEFPRRSLRRSQALILDNLLEGLRWLKAGLITT